LSRSIKKRNATIFAVLTAKAGFVAALPSPEHVSVQSAASPKVNGSVAEVIGGCRHFVQSFDPFNLAEAGHEWLEQRAP
jgi:hypothetical protein